LKNIKEIYSGKSGRAFFITCIGEKFYKIFFKIALQYYLPYCKKYDIGIILISDFIDQNYKAHKLYEDNPGLQRLLGPEEIRKNFPKYKFICDIDSDCIPGYSSRNIFDFYKNPKKNEIYLVKLVPEKYSRADLGKKISLLRRLYQNKNYPLDSLMAASDFEESKIFRNTYKGPFATIGTCIGSTETLANTGLEIYRKIITKKNFMYLQNYRIDYYNRYLNLKWLPYEFQALWNFEASINYPFLFHKNFKKNYYECVMATLHKVDFLHFAGSGIENLIYTDMNYKKKGKLRKYYSFILKYLKMNVKIKSYGKIKLK
jgi:hypothetical protein